MNCITFGVLDSLPFELDSSALCDLEVYIVGFTWSTVRAKVIVDYGSKWCKAKYFAVWHVHTVEHIWLNIRVDSDCIWSSSDTALDFCCVGIGATFVE